MRILDARRIPGIGAPAGPDFPLRQLRLACYAGGCEVPPVAGRFNDAAETSGS